MVCVFVAFLGVAFCNGDVESEVCTNNIIIVGLTELHRHDRTMPLAKQGPRLQRPVQPNRDEIWEMLHFQHGSPDAVPQVSVLLPPTFQSNVNPNIF